MESNVISHTGVMAARHTPWAPPLVEMATGMVGHLLAWERHERDGSWWAWVSWVHESGGRRDHKVGPGAGRQSAPAGAARGLQGSAAPGSWPRWADPQSIARPGAGTSALDIKPRKLRLAWPCRAAAKCSSQNAPCRPQPTARTFTGSAKTFCDRVATSYGLEGPLVTGLIDRSRSARQACYQVADTDRYGQFGA